MNWLALFLELLLGSVLLVAAFGKLLAWSEWIEGSRELHIPLPSLTWRALPLIELVLGTALALGVRPHAGLGAALLFALFTGGLAFSYSRGVRADCNCLGDLLPTRIGPLAIGRALALATAAVALVIMGDVEPLHPPGVAVALAVAAVTLLLDGVRASAAGI